MNLKMPSSRPSAVIAAMNDAADGMVEAIRDMKEDLEAKTEQIKETERPMPFDVSMGLVSL